MVTSPDSLLPAPQTRPRPGSLLVDVLVALLFAGLLAPLLRLDLVNGPELPTGGDMASHVLYASLFDREALPHGQLTAWLPEVFGGYPLHAYYFPLPFVVASLLGKVVGLASGLKWAIVLPALLLPGTVFSASRHVLRLGALAAFCGALGALSFLTHEQNSIWGGNLLSLLAGEFAYSWGLLLAVLTLAAWVRAVRGAAYGWILAGILEALTALGHGYPLLVCGFGSWLLLIDAPQRTTATRTLLKGHALAFLLLGGWLWPLLEMHGFTIPNDGSSTTDPWEALLPEALWPILAGGALSLPLTLRKAHLLPSHQPHAILYFLQLTALAILLWMLADRIGLLDIRFLPMAWLFGAIAAGWSIGTVAASRTPARAHALIGAVLLAGLATWLAPRTQQAPQWALWNFSGNANKPGWQALERLLPAMTGSPDSPRLLFEHDPANLDLGSTRSLEALPLLLGGRPVLEGLYMESAILGPAIYQLQSEVSAHPSSPLSRFPSGQLDPAMAATHMGMLQASQVLLRSTEAKRSLLASGLFEQVADSPPFLLLRPKSVDTQLVDGAPHPWLLKPRQGWMQDSHAWFKSRARLGAEWPVYVDSPDPALSAALKRHQQPAQISELQLDRDRLSFTTSAPGQAHLIKISYHPRWQLETKGSLHLAAPGFLLVVPEEASVRLVFGTTTIGRWGTWASCLALLGCLVMTCSPRRAGRDEIPTDCGHPRWRYHATALLIMAGTACWLYLSAPERIYAKAWSAMQAERFSDAAALFLDARQHRRAPPAREEALFWAAKSLERAGKYEQACSNYRELFENGYGFWVPESLYSYARLMQEHGHPDKAREAGERLNREFPDSEWSRKLTPGQR
jgi:hypothetical protein